MSSSTRERLLLQAGQIFAAKGYEAATIREICDAAGVNLASINYYFGDKSKLYLEAVRTARQRRADQFPFSEQTPDEPAELRLENYVRVLLNRLVVMQQAPWEVQLLMREVMHPTDACRHLSEQYFRPFFEVLLGIVGELAGREIDATELEHLGYSIIGQVLFYRYSADMIRFNAPPNVAAAEPDIDRLAKHIARFSIAGIRGCGDCELGMAPLAAAAPVRQQRP